MRKYSSAFTLIELMIVVAIIGILAAVAIPKFAGLLDKSKEATAKSNIGLIRSAINLYYTNNEAFYPVGPAGAAATTLDDVLVPIYIGAIPECFIYPHHDPSRQVDNYAALAALTNQDTGTWGYISDSSSLNWGAVVAQCTHADSKGSIWSSH